MRRALVVLAAMALLAGCGTTADLRNGAAVAGGDGLNNSGVPTGPAGSTVTPSGSISGDASGSAAPTAGGRPQAGVAGESASMSSSVPGGSSDSLSSSSPSAATVTTAPGPAVTIGTNSVINIGVAYEGNLSAYNASLGGSKVTSGNQVAEAQILMNKINAAGGIRGHKVALTYYAYNAESLEPYATQDQAACDYFTQDTHVFAVIGGGVTSNFEQCMQKAGISVFGSALVDFNQAEFAQFPHYYDVQQMDLDRLMPALAGRLYDDDYFTGWNAALGRAASGTAKVGVITFDDAKYVQAVNKELLPDLAAHQVHVASSDVVFITDPSSQSDDGPAASQIQNAILRFRQDGVDHVVIVDAAGGITQILLAGAYSQDYRPRYGVESGSGVQILLSAGIINASELAGTDGLGWVPAADLPNGADTTAGPYSSPDQRTCLALMAANGQTYSDTNAETIALIYCDEFWLLQRALDDSSVPLTQAGLQAGIQSLGTKAPAADLGAASYGPDKHEAVARAYPMSFENACSCMAYSGPPQPIT